MTPNCMHIRFNFIINNNKLIQKIDWFQNSIEKKQKFQIITFRWVPKLGYAFFVDATDSVILQIM